MTGETCVSCGTGEIDLEQKTCPECGSAKYEEAESCTICLECGFSPCS